MLNYSAATMFSPNKIRFIFIVVIVMCSISESFWLHTEKSLTAVRGGNISLPCNFSVSARAVYWYKHDFTGAPDDGTSLVARYYRGITEPVPGFERFSITNDYSLIIRNVTVQDETTYSCQVVGINTIDVETERGYTDLRVIALAEPLEPIIEIIEPCTFTAQGGCVYHVNRSTIGKDTSEDVILVSKLSNVRPLPNLTWIQSDGRLNKNATYQTQEKDGLFSISSQIQVSRSHLDHHYTCQAEGEAVNGTSSVVISFEDSVTHVSNDRVTTMVISVIIAIILLVVIMVIVVLSVGLTFYRSHGRWPWLTRDPERSKTNGLFMAVESNVDDDEPDQYRRESSRWCSCGNCPVMETDVECLCCRELKRCREIQTNGCIIDSNRFKFLCLDKPSLRVFLSLRSKDHQIPGYMENKSYRFAAFRIWSDYLHDYMGKGVRWPLPACVVTRVRQEFPNKTGVYAGFKFGKHGKVGKKSVSFVPNNPTMMNIGETTSI
ncbi:uncharacterized protein LOC129267461 [Lytechinus pictus]|uniref:uncharacterized protein LOC129267461 n=1 Tax=Lytechinus pictus TaxID=7653 RepID=UPI0030BA0FDB